MHTTILNQLKLPRGPHKQPWGKPSSCQGSPGTAWLLTGPHSFSSRMLRHSPQCLAALLTQVSRNDAEKWKRQREKWEMSPKGKTEGKYLRKMSASACHCFVMVINQGKLGEKSRARCTAVFLPKRDGCQSAWQLLKIYLAIFCTAEEIYFSGCWLLSSCISLPGTGFNSAKCRAGELHVRRTKLSLTCCPQPADENMG